MDTLDEVKEEHFNKFNIEPKIIGLFWSDRLDLADAIKESIDNNKPYDEYDLLTEEQKRLFDKGELIF